MSFKNFRKGETRVKNRQWSTTGTTRRCTWRPSPTGSPSSSPPSSRTPATSSSARSSWGSSRREGKPQPLPPPFCSAIGENEGDYYYNKLQIMLLTGNLRWVYKIQTPELVKELVTSPLSCFPDTSTRTRETTPSTWYISSEIIFTIILNVAKRTSTQGKRNIFNINLLKLDTWTKGYITSNILKQVLQSSFFLFDLCFLMPSFLHLNQKLVGA